MTGNHRQGRQQRDRLKISNVLGGPTERFDIGTADRDRVLKKDHIHFTALSGLGDLDVMFKIYPGINLRTRMSPGRDVVPSGVKEYPEPQLRVHRRHRILADFEDLLWHFMDAFARTI